MGEEKRLELERFESPERKLLRQRIKLMDPELIERIDDSVLEKVRMLPSKEKVRAGEKIPLENLVAVHLTNCFPEGGMMKTRFSVESRIVRDTIHFSLNHPVESHMFGNWEETRFAILVPLDQIEERLLNLNPVDTFILGELRLPKKSVILGEFNDLAPHMAVCEQIIKMGYTPMIGSKDYWLETGIFDGIKVSPELPFGLKHANHWTSLLENLTYDLWQLEQLAGEEKERQITIYSPQAEWGLGWGAEVTLKEAKKKIIEIAKRFLQAGRGQIPPNEGLPNIYDSFRQYGWKVPEKYLEIVESRLQKIR